MVKIQDYPFQYFPNYFDCKDLKNKILQNIDLNRDEIEIGRGEKKVIRKEQRLTKWLSNNDNLTLFGVICIIPIVILGDPDKRKKAIEMMSDSMWLFQFLLMIAILKCKMTLS